MDPWGWCGCWWLVTHGRQLLLLLPAQQPQVLCRYPLPAAGSAAVCFAASHGLAVVALLNGSLLALRINNTALAHLKQQQQQQQQQQHGQELLSVQWQFSGAAPIFSSPVVDEAAGLLLFVAVDGAVSGLGLDSGQLIWRTEVQQHVFADLLLLQAPKQQPAAAAAAGGIKRVDKLAAGHRCLVVATQAGWVVGLSSQSGQELWRQQLGSSRISAAPAAVTTTAQTLLPGEVFSSPVFLDEWLLLGCRDDHLYCLRVA
ncbi:hypothetical protein OEZ86_012116 [Tetradesmus obliquus]|nr:hypothetical protein OEZ86_012116 [Tetradesmus obliquus]